jgi:hypothetical protein
MHDIFDRDIDSGADTRQNMCQMRSAENNAMETESPRDFHEVSVTSRQPCQIRVAFAMKVTAGVDLLIRDNDWIISNSFLGHIWHSSFPKIEELRHVGV